MTSALTKRNDRGSRLRISMVEIRCKKCVVPAFIRFCLLMQATEKIAEIPQRASPARCKMDVL